MNDSVKKLLGELESFEKKNGGFFNVPPETGKFLYNLVCASRAKNILEVGTSNGYSSIWLGEAAAKTGGKVTTIEIAENKAEMAMLNFKRAGLSDRIKIIRGDAIKEIPKLKESYDFMFIDAIKKDYISYFKLAFPNLKKNAVITADNAIIFAKKMEEYLSFARNHKYLSSVLIPIGTGVEFTVKVI